MEFVQIVVAEVDKIAVVGVVEILGIVAVVGVDRWIVVEVVETLEDNIVEID
jgi:hypothetical protein